MPLNHPNKEMKDRIRQIMESQHMTQQVFAQFIEMSPASLSSIFNGRTKPTLNIIEAIRKKIPDISIDWLMFGSGPMYLERGNTNQAGSSPSAIPHNQGLDLDIFSSPIPEVSSQVAENRGSTASMINSVKSTHPISLREDVKIIDKVQRRVTEIRVFYDDQTWESFVPAKK
jgi:transcriptional regulator with XRE-family HTH domain